MVLLPLPPWAMLKLVGDADNVKVGGGVIVNETDVVLFKFPDVPVITTFVAPAAAVLFALNVNTLLPVVLVGLNDAVTPFGSDE